MNAPTRPPMPPQPTTKQLPAVNVPASQLDAVLSEVRALRGDVQIAVDQGQTIGQEVGLLRRDVDELKRRQSKNSDRVAATDERTSQNDMRQDAAIAELVVKVNGIEGKVTAVHSAVTGVLSNPKVRAVARLLFTLAMGYAAAKGIKVLP